MPVVVGITIFMLVVTQMKKIAQAALAFEEVRAIIICYSIIDTSIIARGEVVLQCSSVVHHSFLNPLNTNSVSDLEWLSFMGVDMIPQSAKVWVERKF